MKRTGNAGAIPLDAEGHRLYRVTKTSGQVKVPSDVLRALPEEVFFWCEVTEEGLLYRLADPVPHTVPRDGNQFPEWVARVVAQHQSTFTGQKGGESGAANQHQEA